MIKRKRPLAKVVSCTAYQSRTDDLLRERQLSWTTRRMRHVFLVVISLSKSGAKVRLFFDMAKFIFSFSLPPCVIVCVTELKEMKLFSLRGGNHGSKCLAEAPFLQKSALLCVRCAHLPTFEYHKIY